MDPHPSTCPSARNGKTQAPRLGLEHSANSSKKTPVATESGAESGALGAQESPIDPRLEVLVEAWPSLPEAIKVDILAMMQLAGGAATNSNEP
jgi:hypothetical protein